VSQLIDFILHIDRHLLDLAGSYGGWIYGILFAIVFAETGLVVTPFLPGDSLLFAAGAIAATGALDVRVLALLMMLAAVVGNTVNYSIGRAAGARIIERATRDPKWGRWIRPAYVERAHHFFARHGGAAVVLGRFMPIVRTFVPFVAGAAAMSYPAYTLYNVVGSVAWVGLCVGAGYAFGNVPVIKENFSLVALGIVAISLLPMLFEYLRYRRGSSGSDSTSHAR
jgi:membrane-associated protein